MKRFLLAAAIVLVAALALSACRPRVVVVPGGRSGPGPVHGPGPGPGHGPPRPARPFTAQARGNQVVPPVAVGSRAEATFIVREDRMGVDYTVTVTSPIANPVRVFVASAPPGANGPVRANLYGPALIRGPFRGTICTGTIRPGELHPPGYTMADFLADLYAGRLYLVVTTTSHPMGAIRGQIH